MAPELIGSVLARLQEQLHLDDIDQSAVIRWDVVTAVRTISFQMASDGGHWVFSDGAPVGPTLAVSVAMEDLLGLANGRIGGGEAFLSGRLRLSGDLALAQRLLPGFDV